MEIAAVEPTGIFVFPLSSLHIAAKELLTVEVIAYSSTKPSLAGTGVNAFR